MIARQRNRHHPIFAHFALTLNMNMLRLATIKAEEEQPIGAGNFSYRWHGCTIEFSGDGFYYVRGSKTQKAKAQKGQHEQLASPKLAGWRGNERLGCGNPTPPISVKRLEILLPRPLVLCDVSDIAR